MTPDQDAPAGLPIQSKMPSPWKFVPLLYLLQAIPPTLVNELSSIFYKDLGIPDSTVAIWTSIVALPWSLQFILGPLVDLSARKRQWVLNGQMILTAMLALLPFLFLSGAQAFTVSLIFLGMVGFVSAMTNIATDGFYILAIPKENQASYSGIQTGFYRAGRLLIFSLTPLVAGTLMKFNPVEVKTEGGLVFAVKKERDRELTYLQKSSFRVEKGNLVNNEGQMLLAADRKPVQIPGAIEKFNIQNGVLEVGTKPIPLALYRSESDTTADPLLGSYQPTTYPTTSAGDSFLGGPSKRRMPAAVAWMISVLCVAAIYGLSAVTLRRTLPEAALDTGPSDHQCGQFRVNLLRTLAILGFYGSTYFAGSSVLKLVANQIGQPGWLLPKQASILGQVTPLSGVLAEVLQLIFCGVASTLLWFYLRRSLKNSDMGLAFSTFFKQTGIVPIMAFLLFYRFSEAMVAKMSVLFLKGDLDKRGLALSNSDLSFVKGLVGVFGIILGGIVGALVISRLGLKKGFWVIAVLMHIPILLYVWASYSLPSQISVIASVDFLDQFGYGLGFAGYTIYLMRIAQRGEHQTAHYAIGTGIGGTIIVLAGILGGIVYEAFQKDGRGYQAVFIAALLLSVPGILTLFFIPHDEEPAKA